MKGTFIFLGTGASTGIPVVGCSCSVCSSTSPFNQRLRPSGLIQYEGKSILIDCGPDFRQQALRYHIQHLDALLLTHTHYDHVAGIDDLRGFFFQKKQPLRFFISKDGFEELEKHYDYLLRKDKKWDVQPNFDFRFLEKDQGSIQIDSITVSYFSFTQRKTKVTGFRIGTFAYITDIHEYPDSIFDSLRGVRQLVISAIGERATRAHFSIEQAIDFAKRCKADQTFLTHIGHELDHERTKQLFPNGVTIGYDGLSIDIEI